MSKKVLEKLNSIRKEIKLEKEKGRYEAFTVAKLNAELNPLLDKYKLAVSFNVESANLDKHDHNGKTIFTLNGFVVYTIHDLESDDTLPIRTYFTGMNSEGDPSKSQGNAHSYSYKYLWVILLGLTDKESDVDDPANQAKETRQIGVKHPSADVVTNKTLPKPTSILNRAKIGDKSNGN